jgi:hypothetical protein
MSARALPSALAESEKEAGAGRTCPRDYVYSPTELARVPDLATDALYVVGGLYGNLDALESVEALAAQERVPATIVMNGDFHWFDADPDWFAAIEEGVRPYHALRGNIETEVARIDDVGAGCGCAYPESVDQDVVHRSNLMLQELRAIAPAAMRERLGALPMHLMAQVGDLRVAVVHGDAASLAGWRFAHDALDDPRQLRWFGAMRDASRADVFACTHTCLAALRDFDLPAGRMTVINNGAAGMPNFAGSRLGVVTRIAVTPAPHQPLYGLVRDGVHIDALALAYDHDAFIKRFLGRWPQHSPAHRSYYGRITSGPDHTLAQAAGR